MIKWIAYSKSNPGYCGSETFVLSAILFSITWLSQLMELQVLIISIVKMTVAITHSTQIPLCCAFTF